MKSLYFMLSIVLLLTTACAGNGDSSSDSNPKPAAKAVSGEPCPLNIIEVSNKLITASKEFNNQPSVSLLNEMKAGCSEIKAALGDATCKATSLSSGKIIEISYSQIADACEKILKAK